MVTHYDTAGILLTQYDTAGILLTQIKYYILQIVRGGGCRTKLLICWKTFAVRWQSCMARPIAQAISMEKFRGTDRSAKTTKLFHLEGFAIYSINLCTLKISTGLSLYKPPCIS